MPHNDHLIRRLYGIPEGVRFDPGFDPGIFFFLDALAAIIQNIILCLYHYLIAAPGEGKVNGAAGIFLTLAECISLYADADTDGDGYILPHADVSNLIQQGKLVRLQLREKFVPEQENVLVLFQLAGDGVDIQHIFVDLPVDQGSQQ